MQINPQQLTLNQMLTGENKYKIPNYQRNYSWMNDQINELYSDVKEESTGYYIGNLLLNTEGGIKEIIDGQQRLTTLSLFLLVVYSYLDENGNKDNTDIQDALTFIRQHLKSKNGDTRLQLLNKDQEIWEVLVNQVVRKSDETREPDKRYAFYKRFDFIKNKLIEFNSEKEALEFYNKLTEVAVLEISIPDLSDAYKVFESLNSKGLPLTPLDLMKNSFIGLEGAPEKWQELLNCFGDDVNNSGKLLQFVQNYYDAIEEKTITKSITKGEVVKKYTELFKANRDTTINQMIKGAKAFVKISDDKQTYDISYAGLRKLESTSVYPLLLFLEFYKEDYNISNKDIEKIVGLLINFYVRRNICQVPVANTIRSYMMLLKNKVIETDKKGTDIVDYISGEIKKIPNYPDDNLIRENLEDGLYSRNVKTTRFILLNLERKFGKTITRGDVDPFDKLDSHNKPVYTIEHVLPEGENLPDYWVSMLAQNQEEAHEVQEEYVHWLGNLTITPYNRELGQKSFEDKKKFVDDSGEIVGLNKGLFLNEQFKSIDKWNKEEIISRNNNLIDKVLEVFK